jgi:alpha-glucosidase (family GH31 glycosyl hydrolase)
MLYRHMLPATYQPLAQGSSSPQFSYPLEPDAYHTPGQFLLGNDLIVAPAFSPVQHPPIPPQGGSPGGVVGVSIWVPPAAEQWVDFNAPAAAALPPGWTLYNSSIFTVPVLARAGSVIPLIPRNLTSVPGISGQACVHHFLAIFPHDC